MPEKVFKTLDEQLQILRDRGLIIEDDERAKSFLLNNNYYRISGYSLTLRNHDVFSKSATFQNIIDIYEFDRSLRHLLLQYLDIIEVTFKSIYAYEFCKTYGATGHLNKYNFTDEKIYNSTLRKVKKQQKNRLNDEAYLKHFVNDLKIDIPFWAYVDLFTFSNISILYSISKEDLQNIIARHYRFKSNSANQFLKLAMKNMTIIRNLCAHESRLFNRLFEQRPSLSKNDKKLLMLKPNNEPDNSHLYGFILIMRQLLMPEEFCSLKKALISLCEKYPFVRMDYYGFRADWKEML